MASLLSHSSVGGLLRVLESSIVQVRSLTVVEWECIKCDITMTFFARNGCTGITSLGVEVLQIRRNELKGSV